MANLAKNTESRSAWREKDLIAYNISIVEQDQQTFFGSPLPHYSGPPGFAQYEGFTDQLDDASLSLIKRLEQATQLIEGEESAVADFAAAVLRATGYEHRDTVVRTRKTLLLDICGEEVSIQAVASLMNVNHNILLVVQEDESHIHPAANPEAQLVADAIAAFQMNNVNRVRKFFLPALESQVIPGITMTGTFPRFYKIHVTSQLDDCIREGRYPAVQTTVYRHTPHVPGHAFDAMKPLPNRVLILEFYEAFKKFVYPESDGSYLLDFFFLIHLNFFLNLSNVIAHRMISLVWPLYS